MQLFLLSGPSGGGKSTFIDLLRRGELPSTIEASIFENVAQWPAFDVTNTLRQKIVHSGAAEVWAELGAPQSAILHYDIVSVVRSGRDGYSADPAFELIGPADEVQVVFVRPEPQSLLHQYVSRDRARLAAKPAPARVWNGYLLPAWRRVLEAFGGTGRPEQRLYRNAQMVHAIYEQWAAFGAELARTHGKLPFISIRPCRTADSRPSFELVTSFGGQVR